MEYIWELLGKLEKAEPIETGVTPSYRQDPEIEAVLFDIYGTLLISSSGDIEQVDISTDNLRTALDAANIEVNDTEDGSALQQILDAFMQTLKDCHDIAIGPDRPYPEIDILTVWQKVLDQVQRRNLVRLNGEVNVIRLTYVFEFLSNRVYPMPGLRPCIADLERKGKPLGIVSNAQSYTPVVMNYFLNDAFETGEAIPPFDEDLTVYSYKLGRGKPDEALFRQQLPVLRDKYGLTPQQVLFVGNDMLKDIYTSDKIGFKTALFAGDKRSLRLRQEDARVQNLQPDHVITHLDQLREIVS